MAKPASRRNSGTAVLDAPQSRTPGLTGKEFRGETTQGPEILTVALSCAPKCDKPFLEGVVFPDDESL